MTNPRFPRWPRHARAAFIDTLARTGNVSAAAEAAGQSRAAAYRLRALDPDFAEDWAGALDSAADLLEAEARRRAIEGVPEVIVRAGKIVTDDAGQPVTVRHYSDRLLELLLRAHRPERFRDRPPPAAPSLSLESVDAEIARLEAELARDPAPGDPELPVDPGGADET